MAMPAWVLESWEKLNVENQAQASHYIERLLKAQSREESTTRRELGPLAERFEYIAEDFDAPIDDFKEYM